ncbi:MAG: HAD-IA family hydrolase [Desulfurispora sp.]|uniref:HAD-IA family hydrolase n=1 Tax=Desulfurispora sp. TaxID=3014275 RepID=UPI00404A88FB
MTKNSVQAVLFDLDGTLADTLPLLKMIYRRVFAELDLPWADGAVMRWIGRTLKDIAIHFAGDRAEQFISLYQQYYHAEHDRYAALFPGSREMLEFLKQQGILTGLVTSKGRPGTMRTLEVTGIAGLLDVVITAYDVTEPKPAPQPVLRALQELQVEPGAALMVGDSYFDLLSGKAAGTLVVAVTWGMATREELAEYRPDLIIDSWADLQKYLLDRM